MRPLYPAPIEILPYKWLLRSGAGDCGLGRNFECGKYKSSNTYADRVTPQLSDSVITRVIMLVLESSGDSVLQCERINTP